MGGLLSDIYLPPPIHCGSCYSKYLMLFSVSQQSKVIVSDLRQVDGFLRVLWFHPPI
jgi:hypothetical protein